jgi:hypothetical protein
VWTGEDFEEDVIHKDHHIGCVFYVMRSTFGLESGNASYDNAASSSASSSATLR